MHACKLIDELSQGNISDILKLLANLVPYISVTDVYLRYFDTIFKKRFQSI